MSHSLSETQLEEVPPVAAEEATGHVVCRGLTKVYPNGAKVLEGLDFTIKEGEFVSLIGPSGCGKSTLLKILAGLSPVTEGSVTIGGRTPKQARPELSFIFQDATLLPWRTVGRNVELGLELGKVSRRDRRARVRELLRFVGLDEVRERYPRQLSGGMRMRVSLARALATTPRLLLMDEPFGALDEITRDYLNDELLRLRERDRWTCLFVTHSVPEAVYLSDRILLLAPNPGRIAYEMSVPNEYPRPEFYRVSGDFQVQIWDVSDRLRSLNYQAFSK